MVQKKLTEIMGVKEEKEDWDFLKAKTKFLTFGLHDYPARMIPQIAKRLIKRYLLEKFNQSKKDLIILDPFVGSGTTLTQARIMGLNAIGVDINPLSILISEIQAVPIKNKTEFVNNTNKFMKKFINEKNIYLNNKQNYPIYEFTNNTHWYKEDVLKDLSFIRNIIESYPDSFFKRYLKYCFSITHFNVSNIDKGSSRFLRIMGENRLKDHHPQTFRSFKYSFENVRQKIFQFSEKTNPSNYTRLILGDSRKLNLGDSSVDIIVTSPPYGEERNTINYSRWSKLSLYWLGYSREEILEQATKPLGANKPQNIEIPSPSAKKIIDEVIQIDKNRAKESLSFYPDYLKCLEEFYRVLKINHYACIVIGNRSIKRKEIDMNLVTKELAEKVKFRYIKRYVRNIPGKLIASTTPTGKTINKESIIILQKY